MKKIFIFLFVIIIFSFVKSESIELIPDMYIPELNQKYFHEFKFSEFPLKNLNFTNLFSMNFWIKPCDLCDSFSRVSNLFELILDKNLIIFQIYYQNNFILIKSLENSNNYNSTSIFNTTQWNFVGFSINTLNKKFTVFISNLNRSNEFIFENIDYSGDISHPFNKINFVLDNGHYELRLFKFQVYNENLNINNFKEIFVNSKKHNFDNLRIKQKKENSIKINNIYNFEQTVKKIYLLKNNFIIVLIENIGVKLYKFDTKNFVILEKYLYKLDTSKFILINIILTENAKNIFFDIHSKDLKVKRILYLSIKINETTNIYNLVEISRFNYQFNQIKDIKIFDNYFFVINYDWGIYIYELKNKNFELINHVMYFNIERFNSMLKAEIIDKNSLVLLTQSAIFYMNITDKKNVTIITQKYLNYSGVALQFFDFVLDKKTNKIYIYVGILFNLKLYGRVCIVKCCDFKFAYFFKKFTVLINNRPRDRFESINIFQNKLIYFSKINVYLINIATEEIDFIYELVNAFSPINFHEYLLTTSSYSQNILEIYKNISIKYNGFEKILKTNIIYKEKRFRTKIGYGIYLFHKYADKDYIIAHPFYGKPIVFSLESLLLPNLTCSLYKDYSYANNFVFLLIDKSQISNTINAFYYTYNNNPKIIETFLNKMNYSNKSICEITNNINSFKFSDKNKKNAKECYFTTVGFESYLKMIELNDKFIGFCYSQYLTGYVMIVFTSAGVGTLSKIYIQTSNWVVFEKFFNKKNNKYYICLAEFAYSLKIINFTTSNTLEIISQIYLGAIYNVDFNENGSILFVASYNFFYILDISNITNPAILKKLSINLISLKYYKQKIYAFSEFLSIIIDVSKYTNPFIMDKKYTPQLIKLKEFVYNPVLIERSEYIYLYFGATDFILVVQIQKNNQFKIFVKNEKTLDGHYKIGEKYNIDLEIVQLNIEYNSSFLSYYPSQQGIIKNLYFVAENDYTIKKSLLSNMVYDDINKKIIVTPDKQFLNKNITFLIEMQDILDQSLYYAKISTPIIENSLIVKITSIKYLKIDTFSNEKLELNISFLNSSFVSLFKETITGISLSVNRINQNIENYTLIGDKIILNQYLQKIRYSLKQNIDQNIENNLLAEISINDKFNEIVKKRLNLIQFLKKNHPPIVNTPLQTQFNSIIKQLKLGSILSFKFQETTFIDIDKDTLTLTLNNSFTIPQWIKIDLSNKIIQMHPKTIADEGFIKICLIASDSSLAIQDCFNFTLFQKAPEILIPIQKVFNKLYYPNLQVGEKIEFQFLKTNYNDDLAITFSVLNLPYWLSFDSSSLKFTSLKIDSVKYIGNHTVTLLIKNTYRSITDSFTFEIVNSINIKSNSNGNFSFISKTKLTVTISSIDKSKILIAKKNRVNLTSYTQLKKNEIKIVGFNKTIENAIKAIIIENLHTINTRILENNYLQIEVLNDYGEKLNFKYNSSLVKRITKSLEINSNFQKKIQVFIDKKLLASFILKNIFTNYNEIIKDQELDISFSCQLSIIKFHYTNSTDSFSIFTDTVVVKLYKGTQNAELIIKDEFNNTKNIYFTLKIDYSEIQRFLTALKLIAQILGSLTVVGTFYKNYHHFFNFFFKEKHLYKIIKINNPEDLFICIPMIKNEVLEAEKLYSKFKKKLKSLKEFNIPNWIDLFVDSNGDLINLKKSYESNYQIACATKNELLEKENTFLNLDNNNENINYFMYFYLNNMNDYQIEENANKPTVLEIVEGKLILKKLKSNRFIYRVYKLLKKSIQNVNKKNKFSQKDWYSKYFSNDIEKIKNFIQLDSNKTFEYLNCLNFNENLLSEDIEEILKNNGIECVDKNSLKNFVETVFFVRKKGIKLKNCVSKKMLINETIGIRTRPVSWGDSLYIENFSLKTINSKILTLDNKNDSADYKDKKDKYLNTGFQQNPLYFMRTVPKWIKMDVVHDVVFNWKKRKFKKWEIFVGIY